MRFASNDHNISYIETMSIIPKTLALLEPDDLWPAWQMIDLLEQKYVIPNGRFRPGADIKKPRH